MLFITPALFVGCAHQGAPASAPAQPEVAVPAAAVAAAATQAAPLPSGPSTIEACRALIEGYAIARDQVDAEAYAALFAEDAEFVFGKNRVQGTAAIVALMQERARNTLTRHLMTTTQVRPIDDRTAEGLSYFVVFSEAPAPKEDRPIPSAGPRAVIEYHDRFVRQDDGWRIKRREVKLVYVLRDK